MKSYLENIYAQRLIVLIKFSLNAYLGTEDY